MPNNNKTPRHPTLCSISCKHTRNQHLCGIIKPGVDVSFSQGIWLSPGNAKACIVNAHDCVKPFVAGTGSVRDPGPRAWQGPRDISWNGFLFTTDTRNEKFIHHPKRIN